MDRSLGRRYVIDALRIAGVRAEALDAHFPQNAPDMEWLREAGKLQWIVLTKDQTIWRNPQERTVLLRAAVRLFILVRQDLVGAEMAKIFVNALPGIQRRVMREASPLVFTISRNGQFKRLT